MTTNYKISENRPLLEGANVIFFATEIETVEFVYACKTWELTTALWLRLSAHDLVISSHTYAAADEENKEALVFNAAALSATVKKLGEIA